MSFKVVRVDNGRVEIERYDGTQLCVITFSQSGPIFVNIFKIHEDSEWPCSVGYADGKVMNWLRRHQVGDYDDWQFREEVEEAARLLHIQIPQGIWYEPDPPEDPVESPELNKFWDQTRELLVSGDQ